MTTTTTHQYGTRTLDTMPAPGLPDHIVRVTSMSDRDGEPDLISCDYAACFASQVDDIIGGTGADLIPMYFDVRHDIITCQRCIDAGRHLDDDDPSKEVDP